MAAQVIQPAPRQNGLSELMPIGGAIIGGVLGAGGAGAISGGTASGAGAVAGASAGSQLGSVAGNFLDPAAQKAKETQAVAGFGGVKPTTNALASTDTMDAATRRKDELQNISTLKSGLAQAKQDPDTYKAYGSYIEDALNKANNKYT